MTRTIIDKHKELLENMLYEAQVKLFDLVCWYESKQKTDIEFSFIELVFLKTSQNYIDFLETYSQKLVDVYNSSEESIKGEIE